MGLSASLVDPWPCRRADLALSNNAWSLSRGTSPQTYFEDQRDGVTCNGGGTGLRAGAADGCGEGC
jgi:hypothetical protein